MLNLSQKNGELTLKNNRLIVGISGASGAVYGFTLLEALKNIDSVETHLIISKIAEDILKDEISADALQKAVAMANYCYDINDISASIASGSFLTDGMIIAPCSAKTLSSIANSYGSNLITRSADVVLKERRRLVILFRETPLHLGHIENMAQVTRMGGIILPPVPAFYNKPAGLDDIVRHSVGKALDLFGFDHSLYKRWQGRK